MYYDANGADYISTSSFAIPDTGILTVEVWMKSVVNISNGQFMISDYNEQGIIGHIFLCRPSTSNGYNFYYRYANGTDAAIIFSNFFTNLDNQ
ncbi:MAG: hypothetical protein PHY32_04840 [Candidatus Pacebacteria bacterium]|nr:hypothetical protein [Candidatus Paceibacterota bacterium]